MTPEGPAIPADAVDTAVRTPGPASPRGRRGRRAVDVPELVEKARDGDARSVALLISLVDDASPVWRFWPRCPLDVRDRPAVAMRPRLKVAGGAR